MDLENNVFMLPGPVKMHPRVLNAMPRPAMSHRGEEFKVLNGELRELLRYVFQTEQDVALISGSGTAGLDCALLNLLRAEDKVLCITNGKFGERLFGISKMYAHATQLAFDWGQAIELEKVESKLEAGNFDVVTLCHNETSTGMANQARELGALAGEHGAFYVVDGITSVGGLEVRPDKWGIDILVLGSQKCIAAPAGIAALAVSERAYDRLSARGYYLDLKKHIDALRSGGTPYTPAIPLFFALREALLMIKEEGLDNRIKHTAYLASLTRTAVTALGLELLPKTNYSNTVTAIRYPSGIDDAEFRNNLKNKHNVIVAGGQNTLKGKIFRIGHLGICTPTDLLAAFGAMEATFNECGYQAEGAIEAIVSGM